MSQAYLECLAQRALRVTEDSMVYLESQVKREIKEYLVQEVLKVLWECLDQREKLGLKALLVLLELL